MMRITKRRDCSLRNLLNHGAQAAMNWVNRRDDAIGRWIMPTQISLEQQRPDSGDRSLYARF